MLMAPPWTGSSIGVKRKSNRNNTARNKNNSFKITCSSSIFKAEYLSIEVKERFSRNRMMYLKSMVDDDDG